MGLHRFRRFAFVSLLAAALCSAIPARAADRSADDSTAVTPRYRLGPVVVTPERGPIALDRVPIDLTVIDASRLERGRPFFAADLLREAPGVDVQRAGRLGKITDVRLRGADPRHTLVLFDGIPLNGPWVGSFDFADLGGAGLRQIEVMGGPASSLYGSGAVGGVIQLLPGNSGASPALRGFAEFGGETTLRQGASFASRAETRTLSLSVSRLSSEGDGARDSYRGWNGTLHAEAAIDPATRVRLSGLFTHGVKELPYDYQFDDADFRFHQVRDPNYAERDRVAAGSLVLSRVVGAGGALEAEASGLGGRIVNDNAENAPGGDFQDTRLDNTRWIGSVRARYGGAPALGLQAVAGAEYRRENVGRDDDSRYGGFGSPSSVKRAVHSRALYAQAHAEPVGTVAVDAGVRLEDHERYGAYGVPRVAAAFRVPALGLRVRTGYGRAFTAPTLTDLYYPGYGSASLRPEHSRTYEAGLDGSWLGGRVEGHVTWHDTRFRDLIQSNSFFVADNVGRARLEGKEAAIRFQVAPRLAFGARVAHLPVAKDLTTGNRLPKRPLWRSGADVDWEVVSGLRLIGAWRWSDPYRDPFDFVDVSGRYLDGDTPGYAVLDFAAMVAPRAWPLALRGRVENALGREIQEVKGLPARGRTVTVGIDFRP